MRRVALFLLLGFAATTGCGNVDTTPPEETAALPQQDADEDGFADGDDAIPCVGVRLLVANQAVDQARIFLNGEEIVGEGTFPTTDVVEVFLNVVHGTNSLEVQSALSAHEELHLIVEPADKSARWLDERVDGDAALTDVAFGFDVTASCAGY